MTLKEMLQGRNYAIEANDYAQISIAYGNNTTAHLGNEITLIDTDNKQIILKIRVLKNSVKVYAGDKQQDIERSVAEHMYEELAIMYLKQEQEKERRKAEEEAAKFEQKKNAVYQNLFNIINPRKM